MKSVGQEMSSDVRSSPTPPGSQLREPELTMQWSWIGCCGLWTTGFVVTEQREHKVPWLVMARVESEGTGAAQ